MAKKQTETVSLIETFTDFKKNKHIDITTMIGVLEESFHSVIAKIFGSDENFDVIVNPEKGDCEIYRNRVVVEDDNVEDPNKQIALSKAREIDPDYEVGEDVAEEIHLADFGRRAILTLRQRWLAKSLNSNTMRSTTNTKTAWANSSRLRCSKLGKPKPCSWTRKRTNFTCPNRSKFLATSSTRATT